MEIKAQGAEAIISVDGDRIIKDRVSKGYRIRLLDDALRTRRTRIESNLIREARVAGVDTPQLLDTNSTKITMQLIDGEKVKDVLNNTNFESIGSEMGRILAKLHAANIVHGDFTTSNMLIKDQRIYVIDFGLGFESNRIEDKAVDLYLLYNAIVSAHFEIAEDIWPVILKAYKEGYQESGATHPAEQVIKTFAEIQKRGRYKER